MIRFLNNTKQSGIWRAVEDWLEARWTFFVLERRRGLRRRSLVYNLR